MGGDSAIQEAELGFEAMKLLLQVAWADGEVGAAETEALRAQMQALGLDEAHRAQINACLDSGASLPPPNFGLLRQHRVQVLKLVKDLVQSDGNVSEEEEELFQQIAELLK
jgi:uncharacterized tellurite resistance protein B-like protein